MEFNIDAVWVSIRMFTRTDLYDQPRWHTDGYYYEPFDGNQYKVAITLKGPDTLFYEIPYDLRIKFNEIQNQQTIDNMDKIRVKLNQLLTTSNDLKYFDNINKLQINHAKQYYGVVFIVGNTKRAAVHSEPPIHSERLFTSILPGTKEQIHELQTRWNKEKY